LRGQLATREPAPDDVAWPALPQGLHAALTAYEAALARQPWLEHWPLAASQLALERVGPQQLALTSDDGFAVPIERMQTDALLPLIGVGPISVLCTWDGRFARMLAADTAIGRWHEARS
jgi:hypothetical protein